MRLPLAVFSSLLVGLAFVTTGCSEQGSANEGANAPVKVTISSMFVTVQNDAGIPLTDITVSIVPTTRTTMFTRYVGRLENGESKDIMLGDFSSRDGTPFSLRAVRPRSVEVTGTGADGKTYGANLAWK